MDQHAVIAVIGLTKDPLVWWSNFRGALQVHFLTKASSKLKSIRTLLEPTQPDEWQSYDENTRLRRFSQVQLLDDFTTPVTVVLVECRRQGSGIKMAIFRRLGRRVDLQRGNRMESS
jgi:hypothetical protein